MGIFRLTTRVGSAIATQRRQFAKRVTIRATIAAHLWVQLGARRRQGEEREKMEKFRHKRPNGAKMSRIRIWIDFE